MRKLLILTLYFLFSIAYAQEKKVALIIGNSDYSEFFKPLRTPVNDANAMNWTLQELGFETIKETDVSRDKTESLLNEFQKKASGADIALFYYSGHGGYTSNQEYYLVPSGTYQNSATLAASCYPFNAITSVMEATGAKLKLLFIDACRSPLNGAKGWTEFKPSVSLTTKNKSRGTALYFATSETTAAFVGNGDYSVFTQALLNHLDDSGYFSQVWDNITNEVVNQHKEQKPTKQTSEDFEDFKFNPDGIHISERVKEGLEVVNIQVIPNHAQIKIGKNTYENNCNLYFAFGKKYDIEITADGYESYKNSITVSPNPGSQKSYNFNLSKIEQANLTISSNISNASVFIDNKYAGTVNQKILTITGTHLLKVVKNGYLSQTVKLNLKQGDNTTSVNLSKITPWFLDWDYDESLSLRYHYSSKYQIGVGGMYRAYDTRFSFGGYVGFSPGFFRGWDLLSESNISQTQNIIIGIYDSGSSASTKILDGSEYAYSDFVDPYNEAKYYEANALILGNLGYNLCNGFMLELGLGAGYHQDRYFMKNVYEISQDLINSNRYIYTYEKTNKSHWYKQGSKWSPAVRLGTSFHIPVGDGSITLGGGYTYLPSNNDYSSWDLSAGFQILF